MSRSDRPRGRYAPSPTGELHLGNAATALVAWWSVRARGGEFVLRVEDLDQPRVRPGASERILADLRWLGLTWDEGPDVGGPCAPYEQWERLDRYDAAFRRLQELGRVYPCFCSRKDIQAAASAPQAGADEIRYPGTCARRSEEEASKQVAAGRSHAWRFRVAAGEPPGVDDLVRGPWTWTDPVPPGDFVVRRADGVPAYHLAVVVDDAAMGITEVVRGDDLLPSAVRQLLLYDALSLAPPRYGHVPLLLGPDGVRLSKRHDGTSIRALREQGHAAAGIVGRLAHLLGIVDRPDPRDAASLCGGFSLASVARAPHGLVVDPRSWRQAPGLRSVSDNSSGVGT